MKNFKKGFTLIELLVVVAIIGILASVVLASLNTARSKGADAATKANLDDMRAQAAIDYDTWTNHYYTTATGGAANAAIQSITSTTSCPGAAATGLLADTTFCNGIVASATSSSGTVILNSLDQTWVAGAPLKNGSNANGWWCVDSSGASKAENTTTTSTATANTLAAGITLTTTVCPSIP